MNYLELCQRFVDDVGISGTFESVIDQTGEFKRVTNWIKRAVQSIESQWFDWDFLYIEGDDNLITTVVGVQDYPAPALLNRWDHKGFTITTDDAPLEFRPWNHVKQQTYLNESGDPYAFTIKPNKNIRFYGIPAAVETIRAPYWVKPTELTLDISTPRIPEQFHDIIIYKAMQYYANYESADEVKTDAQEGYAEWFEKLESHSAPSRQATGNVNTGFDIQVVAEGSNYEY